MRASAASTSHQESCHGVQQTVRARRRSDLEQRKPTLSPNAVKPDLRGGPRRRDPHFGTRGRRRAARRSRGAQPRRGWRGARAGRPARRIRAAHAAAPGPEPPARRRHARRPRADPRAARPLLPGAGGDRAAAGCAIPPRDSQGGHYYLISLYRTNTFDDFAPQERTFLKELSHVLFPIVESHVAALDAAPPPARDAIRPGTPGAAVRRPPAAGRRQAVDARDRGMHGARHARRCWPATRCPPSPGGSRCAKAPSRPT